MELLVNLELNAIEGGRYRRPYVAVWVEDGEGFPVRTISLWVQARQPGPRWFPDLRRWFRSDRMRQMTDKTDLIPTVSSPTRQPGKYSVVWDGNDDQKKPVEIGTYSLFIEAAREHGTYQIIKKTINFTEKPFRTDLGGNAEIKSASAEYRRRR
jgi:thiamine biosynthesis lipoprotein